MNRLEVLARQLTAGLVSDVVSGEEGRTPFVPCEQEYQRLYRYSVIDPDGFWWEQAQHFFWYTQPPRSHIRSNVDLRKGPISVEYFKDGMTNLSFNCLDRWVEAGRGGQPCFFWEGNDYGYQRMMTYSEVLSETCRVANWLKGQGVRKGDAVTLYMPQTCELPIAMLACARIGAVHSVVFAGFSADALAQRIMDCGARVVITASGVARGAKVVALKALVDSALEVVAREEAKVAAASLTREAQQAMTGTAQHHSLQQQQQQQQVGMGMTGGTGMTVLPENSLTSRMRVLVLEKNIIPREETPWTPGRDAWWHDEVRARPEYCPAEWMGSEERAFLLYTSGSTGKPKGVVHTIGGFMVAAGTTMRMVFDVRPGDVFWCTADCGWITGHTYLAYGPLLCGATAVLFGSTPAYPDPGRCWRIIEKYKVRVFYTAPTLLRSLLTHGDSWPLQYDRSSLRVLGSVGEPINEAAWRWLHDVIGEGRCPVIDTWWQTETGALLLAPFPCKAWCPQKHGCAGLPFFGVQPVVLDPSSGAELQGVCEGVLAFKGSWPSMARTLHGDHQRYEETYFAPYKGYYFTGDACRRDAEGHYWITGRVDDVINVSGHRIGTAEVEGALTEHEMCAEAAVVGIDHPMKGSSIYAYVTLRDGAACDDQTRAQLLDHVRKAIGPFAVPDAIHWAPVLPKTRSGKIMRRVLRKIACHQEKDLGDITTLSDPGCVEQLIALRGK